MPIGYAPGTATRRMANLPSTQWGAQAGFRSGTDPAPGGVNRPMPDINATKYVPTNTKFQNAAFAGVTPGGSLKDQAMSVVAPWWKRALEETRGGLADNGMLQSTGAMQKLGDINTQYAAKAQEYYDAASMARANLGADIWERITARELQKKQLDSTYKTQMPVDPDFYSYFQNYDFIPQGYGPTGDANATKWDRTDGKMANTDAGRAQAASESQFAKNFELQKQQLAASIASQKAAVDDPWKLMGDDVLANKYTLDDGTVGYYNKPDVLVDSFLARYNIDVRGLAAKGDPRAKALMDALYGRALAPIDANIASPSSILEHRGGGSWRPDSASPEGSPYADENAGSLNKFFTNVGADIGNWWTGAIGNPLRRTFSPDTSKMPMSQSTFDPAVGKSYEQPIYYKNYK